MRPTLETNKPNAAGTRSKQVDIVKGVAIILMVYGHTSQGMIHRGWWQSPAAFFGDRFVYSFHMPAFFFVAGLFVMSSLTKRGSGHFVAEKLKTMLYPYLLFAMVGAAIEPFIGRFKMATAPFRLSAFMTSVVSGQANWFLFVLFLCLMLALVTARIPAWLRLLASAPLGLIPKFELTFINQTLHEFCFVAAGMWIGINVHRLEHLRAVTAVWGLLFLTSFQLVIVHFYGGSALWEWIYIIPGLTGTAGLFLLAKLLDNNRAGEFFAWVGQASLALLLLSPLVQGATREILSRVLHTREFWLQLFLPTFFATLLPAVVWHRRSQWRLGWLFRWPSLDLEFFGGRAIYKLVKRLPEKAN
jgi:fucose 4-O-acetylase-like acetyltransferase